MIGFSPVQEPIHVAIWVHKQINTMNGLLICLPTPSLRRENTVVIPFAVVNLAHKEKFRNFSFTAWESKDKSVSDVCPRWWSLRTQRGKCSSASKKKLPQLSSNLIWTFPLIHCADAYLFTFLHCEKLNSLCRPV